MSYVVVKVTAPELVQVGEHAEESAALQQVRELDVSRNSESYYEIAKDGQTIWTTERGSLDEVGEPTDAEQP